MARIQDVTVDELQDIGLYVTVYPEGTSDAAIDARTATPEDISLQTYELVIHAKPGDEIALKRYAPGSGLTYPNGGADGLMLVVVPEADLVALGDGDFRYYVRRTDPGAERVVTKGSFSVVAV